MSRDNPPSREIIPSKRGRSDFPPPPPPSLNGLQIIDPENILVFSWDVQPALYTLPDHIWLERISYIFKLSINMSYSFESYSEIMDWVSRHETQIDIVREFLSTTYPLNSAAYFVALRTIDDLDQWLPFHWFYPVVKPGIYRPMPNIEFKSVFPDVFNLDSTILRVINAKRPNAIPIKLKNVSVELLQSIRTKANGLFVDFTNDRFTKLLRIGIVDIIKYIALQENMPVEPFNALALIMQRYEPYKNIANHYNGPLILAYKPALYYAVGYWVIGKNLLTNSFEQVVHNPVIPHAAYLLTNLNIKNIQQTIQGNHNPLGPGGFAWLLIGFMDFLRNQLASPRGSYLVSSPNNQYTLIITVTRFNGAIVTFSITQNVNVLAINTDQAAVNRANFMFGLAGKFYGDHIDDFYETDISEVLNFGISSIMFQISPAIRSRAVNYIGKGIDGNNIYWESLLVPGESKFKGFRAQFVLFSSRDEEKNQYLHGCIYRALSCTCTINDHDMPVFCKCPLPIKQDCVYLEDLKRLCVENGDRFIVFIIWISKLDKYNHSHKEIEFFHLGRNYYSLDGKVLYVSMPEWQKVQGHCALWLPSRVPKKARDKDYGMFLSMSAYNSVNSKITGKKELNICPICGDYYQDSSSWGHFLRHFRNNVCPNCGLQFDDEDVFNIHVNYHCKKLSLLSTIVLNGDPIVYKEPEATDLWICVYADLESAILPSKDGERLHENILVGWVDDYNKEVRIERDIKEFLNSLVKLPTTDVIIYFHNGEGYDFHFILRDLCASRKGFVKDFSIVGDSGQKVRFFSVKYRNKNLHFRDSFAFVSDSLDNWVKSSKKSGCPFTCFKSSFDEYKQTILLRKNPFPYNAIMSKNDLERGISELWGWARCDIAEELFCYKYSKEELQEFSDWLEANYKQCEWHTVMDYYKDYLKCDVSQLKDVMDFFAKSAEEEFRINIHSYYGTPSLTWAAWLKQNKFPLEPIVNSKHYDVINSTIRGGQTGVYTRLYKSSTDGGCLFDLDCNSLYATVMLKYEYPCHDWKEEIIPDISGLLPFIQKLHENGRSAFFEIDMTVLEKEEYLDYIPIASKRLVKGVYNYQAMQYYETENPDSMFFKGLTQVVGKHEHYCCHSRNLEWYITHGIIEIIKIWFILSGKDEPVFRDYVQNNLTKRKEHSDDPIKKMLYKLLNNSLYGKTYEDETQRADFYLEPKENVDPENHIKVKRVITEMDDWVLYEGTKDQFIVNKPIYLGACITEFSKLWMYIFFYDKVRSHYPDCRVYYTDTDALTIFFPTRVSSLLDLARELNTTEEQIIDTSNFDEIPSDEIHTKHNNEPGLFKSETGNHRIVKFIGLRAKTYIMLCDDESVKMSVKGCPMKEKEKLTWEDFEKVLFSKGEGYTIDFDAIRSKYHLVKSVTLSKIVLSADDRKRYILPDLIHTKPLYSKEHLEALQS